MNKEELIGRSYTDLSKKKKELEKHISLFGNSCADAREFAQTNIKKHIWGDYDKEAFLQFETKVEQFYKYTNEQLLKWLENNEEKITNQYKSLVMYLDDLMFECNKNNAFVLPQTLVDYCNDLLLGCDDKIFKGIMTFINPTKAAIIALEGLYNAHVINDEYEKENALEQIEKSIKEYVYHLEPIKECYNEDYRNNNYKLLAEIYNYKTDSLSPIIESMQMCEEQ